MRSLRVLNILIVLVIAHSWVRLPSCTRGSRWPGTLPPGTLPPVHHGPLKAHTINDGNETEYRRFVAPAVHSRDTLFGAPMLPRDSIDRAVHSKLDVDDTNHMQALAGLEKNTPTELRMGTTTNEGGEEVTNVVETVDTFRFTISAADMERLSQAEAQDGHMQAATINADGTDGPQDAGQKLLADRAFLERLDSTTVEYNEEGKKVLRVEMDLAELEDILGHEKKRSGTDTPSIHERRQAELDRKRAFSHEKMRQAERQVEKAVATDMDDVSLLMHTDADKASLQSDRGAISGEQKVPGMLESGMNKPRWALEGADVRGALGALSGSVLLLGLSSLYLFACDLVLATISRVSKACRCFYSNRRGGLLLSGAGSAARTGVTVPYVTLIALLVYVSYHGGRHIREKRRFAGIGHPVASKTFMERLLPGSSLDIF